MQIIFVPCRMRFAPSFSKSTIEDVEVIGVPPFERERS